MSRPQLLCPECSTKIDDKFLFCPICGVQLKEKDIDRTLNGIESLLSDPKPLSSAQLSIIYKIFQDNAKNDQSTAHLLEEKICHKFIRSISETEYPVKDMIVVAKKILALIRTQYSREY